MVVFIGCSDKYELNSLSSQIKTENKYDGSILVLIDNDTILNEIYGNTYNVKESCFLNEKCSSYFSRDNNNTHIRINKKLNNRNIEIGFCPTKIYSVDTTKVYNDISKVILQAMTKKHKKHRTREILRFGE